MRRVIATLVLAASFFTFTTTSQAGVRPKIQTVKYAINLNWCGKIKKSCYAGRQAFAVASCETGGTFDIWASNGQYKGLFQMGASERRKYGHGWNAWVQARAAHKYYVESGRDWSPWSCRWAAF